MASFKPLTEETEYDFYSTPKRHHKLSIDFSKSIRKIPSNFLGSNTSYFNDTDDVWKENNIAAKLKDAGISALRYPGGEETSFFHWKKPGVNGYESPWEKKSMQGYSPHRGAFQETWTKPEDWATNSNNMDYDEFIQHCRTIGAEPIVGLNLSSGIKFNRRAEGLKLALEWIRYSEEKNYDVKYWFLDNEPWHHEAHYNFQGDEYANEVVYFAKAIKKEFPHLKLIVNPASAESMNYKDGMMQFLKIAGSYIDYIDMHWYWGWGISSMQYWQKHSPLESGTKWKPQNDTRPFIEDAQLLKSYCKESGHEHIELMALEWNVAPSLEANGFSDSMIAVMQSELLLNFVASDIKMTCIWPLLWRTKRSVWPEQDVFRSLFRQTEPYSETRSLDMFKMLSDLNNSTQVQIDDPFQDKLSALAILKEDKQKIIYIVNKSKLRKRIDLSIPSKINSSIHLKTIAIKDQNLLTHTYSDSKGNNKHSIYVEPFSISRVEFK